MYPFGTDEIVDNEEEDIDPFAELEIGTRTTTSSAGNDPLAVFETEDPLEALTDEQESVTEEIVISFEEDSVPELIGDNSEPKNAPESTYKLLLETVWVDDILDPSEVELLARKRKELGLSFERHLQLVRDIIEG